MDFSRYKLSRKGIYTLPWLIAITTITYKNKKTKHIDFLLVRIWGKFIWADSQVLFYFGMAIALLLKGKTHALSFFIFLTRKCSYRVFLISK